VFDRLIWLAYKQVITDWGCVMGRAKTRQLLRAGGGHGQRTKRMDAGVYRSQRRPVIEVIYTAKRWLSDIGVALPRIEVRITEQDNHRVNGSAYLGQNVIFITEDAIKAGRLAMVHTVLHEIVHAATGFNHDEACPLMRSVASHRWGCEGEMKECFLKYFSGRG